MTHSDDAPTGDERQQILQSCKALIFKWASVHFKQYLDQLDEQLFRLTDKSGKSGQGRFLHARSELKEQQRSIEKQLLEHLRLAFDSFLERRDTAPDLARADTELALVDSDELEQSIAVGTMTRRATTDCSEVLYALNQRLSVLAGGHKVIDAGNPVAPAVFADGLRGVLSGLSLDTPSKLVCYKVYDSVVISALHELYGELNETLKQRGVLTNLRLQVVRSDGGTVVPGEFAAFEQPERLERQMELMQLVKQLQSMAALTTTGTSIVGFVLPTAGLADNLHALQRETALTLAAAATPQAVAVSPYAQLPERIQGQTRAAAPVDAATIELVGMLFDCMLDDERLPDTVKALLSYLHTPFLKMALLDQAFFSQPQHPARQLLNSLVAAGQLWVEPDTRHRSDVFQQMKTVVQRILTDFGEDPKLFAQLALEFNQYLRQHARRIRLAEQRAAQAAQGEDTLREVRGRVETLLRARCPDPLPGELEKLLFGPWAQYLAFHLLRGGEQNPAWQDAVSVVDEVLAYWRQPQGIERQRRGRELAPRLQQGLETVGYDDNQTRALLTALQRLPSTEAPATPTPPPAVPAVEPPPELAGLATLEIGTWLEFDADRPQGQRRQCKLAWSNPRTQYYMFVNRLGQQVVTREGAELAAEIAAGRARVLPRDEDRPFFEKALERIAEQLRQRPHP